MLGRLVKKVAKYYNQAYVAIECNGIGEAVFNEVYYHDTEPYDNVYKQKRTKNGKTIMTGWDTNVKTRQLMTNQLIDWFTVEELFESMKIKSVRLYQELTTWVWVNGRVDHAEGSHDDTIIAWGLCIYLRNKASSYGDSIAFIAEDGKLFEFEDKDKDRVVNEGSFDYVTSEDSLSSEAEFLEEMGVENMEQYKWLIGDF